MAALSLLRDNFCGNNLSHARVFEPCNSYVVVTKLVLQPGHNIVAAESLSLFSAL